MCLLRHPEMVNPSKSKCRLGAKSTKSWAPTFHLIPSQDSVVSILRWCCSCREGTGRGKRNKTLQQVISLAVNDYLLSISNQPTRRGQCPVDREMAPVHQARSPELHHRVPATHTGCTTAEFPGIWEGSSGDNSDYYFILKNRPNIQLGTRRAMWKHF